MRERDRWVVLAFAIVLGALVAGACLTADGSDARQLAVLYVLPVALCGVAGGVRGALVAVPLGIGLLVGTTIGDHVGDLGYAAEATAVLAAGGVSGFLESERARARLRDPGAAGDPGGVATPARDSAPAGTRPVDGGSADTRWFEVSNELLAEASLDGYLTRLSERWETALGWTRAELMSRPMMEFVHPDDREATRSNATRLDRGPGEVVDFENRYLAKDGTWHWLLWSTRSDGQRKYAVAKDITARKAVEQEQLELLERLEELARTDALTSLPNRRSWDEELPRAVERSRRSSELLALAMVDLDDFKKFNDTFGHAAGDAFLAETAERWRASLRTTDFLARYGGEEFAVLLPGCAEEEAAQLAERLRSETPGRQTCSVGIAHWDFVEDLDALVRRADAALYDAKRLGRDRVVTSRPGRPPRG